MGFTMALFSDLLVHLGFMQVSIFFVFQTEMFLEHEVTYQQFVDNPALIDDPNLVVKIGNK